MNHMVGFKLPGEVEDNTDGWGPISVPPQFESVPFMPFGKGDRLGKIADFGGTSGRSQHYQSMFDDDHLFSDAFILPHPLI